MGQQITNNKQQTTHNTQHTQNTHWWVSFLVGVCVFVCVRVLWSKREFYRCRALFGGNLFSGPLIYWHARANALNIFPTSQITEGWLNALTSCSDDSLPTIRCGSSAIWISSVRLAIQITLIEFHFYPSQFVFVSLLMGLQAHASIKAVWAKTLGELSKEIF